MMEQPFLDLADRPPVNRLERDFLAFHAANPSVYTLLLRFAREWRSKRKGACGIGMLYERARWEAMMATDTPDGFKLNNNHCAYYARKMMEENADLAGIFNLRAVVGERC